MSLVGRDSADTTETHTAWKQMARRQFCRGCTEAEFSKGISLVFYSKRIINYIYIGNLNQSLVMMYDLLHPNSNFFVVFGTFALSPSITALLKVKFLHIRSTSKSATSCDRKRDGTDKSSPRLNEIIENGQISSSSTHMTRSLSSDGRMTDTKTENMYEQSHQRTSEGAIFSAFS